ncbi:hypothetical protein EG68_02219 [Paragonimus skrjabini miyazakii]|uniref:CUB domain-containing protein n=1 Tax=Paragonimus skrjabini miyazakii TaxID=59628 RepID=A0A8S9Z5A5_9TREM|nr:hypothetical protein EG68_02219 [Paragonimus skrjabini miyazakii]
MHPLFRNSASCGGQLASTSGTLNSESIAPLETCVWTITSAPNTRVHLQLDSVNVRCNRAFVGEFTEEFGNSWGSEAYPEFAFCNWQITVDPGRRIYLDFSRVNVESTQLFGRFYDTVLVFDGPTCTSNIIGMFSGTTPMNFTSSVNQIAVMFFTDDSLQDFGFVASYNTTLAEDNAFVKENLSRFGTSKNAIFSQGFHRYLLQKERLLCQFPNFCILTALTQCGGEMTSNSGMITTAGIEPYQLCIWRVTVESDKRIILMIESVDLPTMTDWYRVFDGGDCLGKPIIYAKGITSEKPPSMKSTNNTVVFVTFGGKVKITYNSDCYGNFTGQPQGGFKSPLYSLNYPALSFCNWQVTANLNERLVIRFTQMDVENMGFNGHLSDYILLFDGPSCISPMIGKFTGNQSVTFLSSANHLSTMFISDASVERTGFVAEFFANSAGSTRIEMDIADSTQQTATNCSQIFMNQRNGIISSPNYPGSYPAYAFCNWKITVARDDRILLSLTSVQIESPGNGAQISDVLIVFDGPTCLAPTIAKISGNASQQITSSTNQLSAMFISDDSLEGRGFQATFSAVTCGGDFKGRTGTYSSAGILLNDLCIWRLTAAKHRRLLLRIQSVTLSTPATWYRIMDGDDCLSNVRHFVRGPSTETPGPIKSSRSQLVVITVGGILDFSYEAEYLQKHEVGVVMHSFVYMKNNTFKIFTITTPKQRVLWRFF